MLGYVLKASSIGLSLYVTGRVEQRGLCTHGGEKPGSASEKVPAWILAQAHAETERNPADRRSFERHEALRDS